jgi:hypothetical protein
MLPPDLKKRRESTGGSLAAAGACINKTGLIREFMERVWDDMQI